MSKARHHIISIALDGTISDHQRELTLVLPGKDKFFAIAASKGQPWLSVVGEILPPDTIELSTPWGVLKAGRIKGTNNLIWEFAFGGSVIRISPEIASTAVESLLVSARDTAGIWETWERADFDLAALAVLSGVVARAKLFAPSIQEAA